MNSRSISPIRTSRTPKPQIKPTLLPASRISVIRPIKSKKQEAITIKQELKNSRELVKVQKAKELTAAKEKVKALRKIKVIPGGGRIKSLTTSESQKSFHVKIKSHLEWIEQVEKRVSDMQMKIMDEQENKLIIQINRACNNALKSNGESISQNNLSENRVTLKARNLDVFCNTSRSSYIN